jgi:acyl carrier protein
MSRDHTSGTSGTTGDPGDPGLAAFLGLLRDGLGLDLTEEEAAADFDALPDWDSVHLLRLVMVLERETGRSVPVGPVLRARSMREIHELVGPVGDERTERTGRTGRAERR